jgi:cbb3-type cytochrome oxidase subunit 1
MTQIVELFVGIIIAALVFAATLFSAAQVFRQEGRLRYAHAAALLLTLAAMACLSLGWWRLSQGAGAGLAAAAVAVLGVERGWNRLLAFAQLGFGIVVALGLPFGG